MPETLTQVDFYVLGAKVDDLRFACRLVDKAYARGQRVYVRTEDAAQAQRLDDLLWTFNQGAFIPHDLVETVDAEQPAPIIIGPATATPVAADVLINLAEDMPRHYANYARVAEIVGAHETAKNHGRARFRTYRAQGITPHTHTMDGEGHA